MRAELFVFVIPFLVGCRTAQEPQAAPPSPPPSALPSAVASVAKPTLAPSATTPTPPAVVAAAMVDAGVAPPDLDAKSIRLEDAHLREWVEARVRDAKAGKKMRLRLPLVHHGDGWGCVCPPYYIGDSPTTGQGPWIQPVFAKGARALAKNEVRMVEGAFDGTVRSVSYPNGPSDKGTWDYDLLVFQVTRVGNKPPTDTDEVTLEQLAP